MRPTAALRLVVVDRLNGAVRSVRALGALRLAPRGRARTATRAPSDARGGRRRPRLPDLADLEERVPLGGEQAAVLRTCRPRRPNRASVQLSFTTSKGLFTFNTAYYFQDDWHVANNFQVNMGLRYEYSPPLHGGFNVDSGNPYGPYNAPGTPMFASDANDFGPRLGMVWRVGPKTVVRTGGAISYIMPQPITTTIWPSSARLSPESPLSRRLTSRPNFCFIRTPWAFRRNSSRTPLFCLPIFTCRAASRIIIERDTYVNMWNFTVQRELSQDFGRTSCLCRPAHGQTGLGGSSESRQPRHRPASGSGSGAGEFRE